MAWWCCWSVGVVVSSVGVVDVVERRRMDVNEKNSNKQKQQQTKTATNKNSNKQKQPTETVNNNTQQHSYFFHHFATGGGGKRNKTVHSSVRGQNDFIRDVVLFLLRLRGKGFGGTEKINQIDQRRSRIKRSEEGVESIKAIRSKKEA